MNPNEPDNTNSESNSADIPESKTVEYVRSWAKDHGISLEMKVAGIFRKLPSLQNSFSSVSLGRTYVDCDPLTETLKVRETDVVVVLERKSAWADTWISICMVIECKSGVNSPWVLYSDSTHPNHARYSPFGSLWKLKHENDVDPSKILGANGSQLLSGNEVSTGYSIVSANATNKGGNQKNHARDAVLQALSAVEGISHELSPEKTQPGFLIYIPIVVTSAPLCNINLPHSGEYSISEINRGLFFGRVDSGSDSPNGVWIITEDEIENFAKEIVQDIDGLSYRN